MREDSFRSVVKRYLMDILASGASGVSLIGPDGFPIESVGDISNRDEGLAIIFAIGVPNAIQSINNTVVSTVSRLLREKIGIEDIHISEFSFRLGDRVFLGLYVDGYTIVASAKRTDDVEALRAGLINVISKIFEVFKQLSGKELKVPIPVVHKPAEVPSKPTVSREREKVPVVISEKKAESLRLYLLKIRELIFDIKKDLIEHGDWYTALQGFKRFKEKLEELSEIDSEIGNHPAIKAILNWVSKTIARIEMILDAKGNEIIDEARKNVLRRGLSKSIEYIRFVIGKGIER